MVPILVGSRVCWADRSCKLARDAITETAETQGLGDLKLLSVPAKRKQPAMKPALGRLTRMRA